MDVVALVFGLLGFVFALAALQRVQQRTDERHTHEELPQDVLGLRQEVAALRAENRTAMRHLAVVRYDALQDMGGRLSWSLALLDDAGDGMLLTSIHGRAEVRTYAKTVAGWRSLQELSPEEERALSEARPSAV